MKFTTRLLGAVAVSAMSLSALPAYAECGGLMYLAKSIEWAHDGLIEKNEMVGCIDTDIIMEERPQGRGYVQLEETEFSPWPRLPATEDKSSDEAQLIYAHEFHYSRFSELQGDNSGKNTGKDVKFAYHVKRGTGINGKSDGYIHKNLLANYTHQRNTHNNPWAYRFIEFARQCKIKKSSQST
jgi:cobyrinic acid a,c-diamide synthase